MTISLLNLKQLSIIQSHQQGFNKCSCWTIFHNCTSFIQNLNIYHKMLNKIFLFILTSSCKTCFLTLTSRLPFTASAAKSDWREEAGVAADAPLVVEAVVEAVKAASVAAAVVAEVAGVSVGAVSGSISVAGKTRTVVSVERASGWAVVAAVAAKLTGGWAVVAAVAAKLASGRVVSSCGALVDVASPANAEVVVCSVSST